MNPNELIMPAQLHEIVKDVPEGAWPTMFWCPVRKNWSVGAGDWSINFDHAVLLWEASMTRWLAEESAWVTIQRPSVNYRPTYQVLVESALKGYPNVEVEDPILVRALASACVRYGAILKEIRDRNRMKS